MFCGQAPIKNVEIEQFANEPYFDVYLLSMCAQLKTTF